MEWITYLLAALFLLLALVIFLGKGDCLIAGYNTAYRCLYSCYLNL